MRVYKVSDIERDSVILKRKLISLFTRVHTYVHKRAHMCTHTCALAHAYTHIQLVSLDYLLTRERMFSTSSRFCSVNTLFKWHHTCATYAPCDTHMSHHVLHASAHATSTFSCNYHAFQPFNGVSMHLNPSQMILNKINF